MKILSYTALCMTDIAKKETFKRTYYFFNRWQKFTANNVVKCQYCGQEFLHEKDRLHHSREEHKNVKRSFPQRIIPDEYRKLQDRVDKYTHNFSDDL